MNRIAVASELLKVARELAADTKAVKEFVDFIEAELKRYSKSLDLHTIYSQIGTGGDGVHARCGAGNYSIWVEDEEDGEYALDTGIFGEAHRRIDAVWDDLKGKTFKTKPELKRILSEFVDQLSDVESELMAEEEAGE